MEESYFAIRLILRYGNLGSIILGVLAALMACYFLWEYTSWLSLIIGLFTGSLVAILCRSYVELMYIVFHMLH